MGTYCSGKKPVKLSLAVASGISLICHVKSFSLCRICESSYYKEHHRAAENSSNKVDLMLPNSSSSR